MKITNNVYKRIRWLHTIKDYSLFKAICEAVYLIEEHNFNLQTAIETAGSIYPVKSHIEKNVRLCYPGDWFLIRARKKFLSRMSESEYEHLIDQIKSDYQLKREFKRIVKDRKKEKQLELF
jgi:hypothetical protein